MASFAAIQPKSEIGALQFITESGGCDGTGTIVAILDTGVDPGAVGLLTCPDGRPKVIDIIDCTGSGDVDTSTVVKATGGTVAGFSGRTVTLNPAWVNPTGDWRLGVKRGMDLYPNGLAGRVKTERKKAWDAKVHAARVTVKQAEAAQAGDAKTAAGAKKDAEACLEVLGAADDAFDDPGPVFDCVVWHDGEEWCAAVDSEETGDLSDCEAMVAYRLKRQFKRFSSLDNLNYTISVHDNGSILNICCDVGAHGTHVAGMVAAYHPENPELNGVAPGAQIVSLRIGDSRLGSMETGVGLERALIESVRLKVDLINLSYGEAVSFPNKGRIIRLAEQIVYKHGITFVSSAGNNGPALTTVGAPGGSSTALIGVAAAITPSMMEASHGTVAGGPIPSAVRGLPGGTTYTWSSVGPTVDGARGVSICAPGGAISPVPTWTLNSRQLMNGTSMSSPNACGGLALVIGAAKQRGVKCSVHLLRRALENSAVAIVGVHAVSQGHGMLSVPGTFAWLERFGPTSPDCAFKVEVGSGRGVYLRQAFETATVSTHSVSVTPVFHEDTCPEVRQALELHLDLTSSAPGWLTCPSKIIMCHGGRGFSVVLDPTGLRPGLHSATVRATLRGAPPGSGWLFEVPVTVAKPEAVASPTVDLALSCEVGSMHRRFFTPPRGATWVDITVVDRRSGDAALADSSNHLMALHAVQLLPHTPYSNREAKAFVSLRPGGSKTLSLALDADLTVEVCLATFWSTASHVQQPFGVAVDFRGSLPSPSALALGFAGPSRVAFSAPLRDEELCPAATLTTWRRALHPAKHTLTPCGDRDVLPDGKRLFQLVLEYAFEAPDDGAEVTFRAPLLNGLLYDAEFGSQFFLVADKDKKLVGFGDAFAGRDTSPAKLKKGAHTVRYQVKHDDLKKLGGLAAMVVVAERKLKEALAVPCFLDAGHASLGMGGGGAAAGSLALGKGSATSVVFSAPAADKLPACVAPGDELTGTLSCVKKAQDKCRPGGWPVSFVVPPAPPKAAAPEAAPEPAAAADKSKEGEESEAVKLDKQVLSLKVKALGAFDGAKPPKDAAWDELFASLASSPGLEGHLPLAVARLHHLDRDDLRAANRAAVAAAADEVIALVNPKELSGALGLRAAEGGDAKRKELVEARATLVDALARKARAALGGDTGAAAAPEAAPEAFKAALADLMQWEDAKAPANAKAMATVALRALQADGHGATLKYCKAALEKGDALGAAEAEVAAARGAALAALGWGWLVAHEKVWEGLNKPKTHALF